MTANLIPWVVAAGAMGAVGRALVADVLARWVRRRRARRDADSPGYPVGTLVVNLVGAWGGGLVLGLVVNGAASPTSTILSVGFLGAFTTFSTWMTEVVDLWEDTRRPAAAIHLFGSLAAGLALAGVGLLAGSLLSLHLGP